MTLLSSHFGCVSGSSSVPCFFGCANTRYATNTIETTKFALVWVGHENVLASKDFWKKQHQPPNNSYHTFNCNYFQKMNKNHPPPQPQTIHNLPKPCNQPTNFGFPTTKHPSLYPTPSTQSTPTFWARDPGLESSTSNHRGGFERKNQLLSYGGWQPEIPNNHLSCWMKPCK